MQTILNPSTMNLTFNLTAIWTSTAKVIRYKDFIIFSMMNPFAKDRLHVMEFFLFSLNRVFQRLIVILVEKVLRRILTADIKDTEPKAGIGICQQSGTPFYHFSHVCRLTSSCSSRTSLYFDSGTLFGLCRGDAEFSMLSIWSRSIRSSRSRRSRLRLRLSFNFLSCCSFSVQKTCQCYKKKQARNSSFPL